MGKKVDKSTIEIAHKFNDFAECTEYYYEELGKLKAVKESDTSLTKKEVKKIHGFIMTSFFTGMERLQNKMQVFDKVEKTEVKEFSKDFDKEHKKGLANKLGIVLKNIAKPVKCVLSKASSAFKQILPPSKKVQVEVLDEIETQKLPGGGGTSFSSALPEGKNEEEMMQNDENKEGEELSQEGGKVD